MREFLEKLLTLNSNSSERNAIVSYEIQAAKDEHVELAYIAALGNASNMKIIYLLGGNNPEKCPFI